jgi:hypothetical protein
MKENIWFLYETEHMSKLEISKRVGVSRGKVIEILKQPKFKNEQLLDTVNEMNRESNESLVKMLREDSRLPSIANKILNIMDDPEQLQKEIERGGLRTLATVFGILSDKAMKAIEMDKAKTDDNVTVKIINNAPEQPVIEVSEVEQDGININ